MNDGEMYRMGSQLIHYHEKESRTSCTDAALEYFIDFENETNPSISSSRKQSDVQTNDEKNGPVREASHRHA